MVSHMHIDQKESAKQQKAAKRFKKLSLYRLVTLCLTCHTYDKRGPYSSSAVQSDQTASSKTICDSPVQPIDRFSDCQVQQRNGDGCI